MYKYILAMASLFASVTIAYKEIRELQFAGYRVTLKCRSERGSVAATEELLLIVAFIVSLSLVPDRLVVSYALLSAVMVVIATINIIGIVRSRTKLKFTNRAIRICLVSLELILILLALSLALKVPDKSVIVLAGVCTATARVWAILGFFIMYPFDSRKNKRFIALAREKYLGSKAVKIGITGSFGKTSCKSILSQILSHGFKVLCSEGNFNTPMGLAKTAMKLSGDEEVIIAEMGARRKGDIDELVKIVKPDMAIITGICSEHLETFGDVWSIYHTKQELVNGIPSRGYAVFNGNNDYCVKMFEECGLVGKSLTALEYSFVKAKNVALTSVGTVFDLIIGDKEYKDLHTRLLGRHNIDNILLCVDVALHLGMTGEEIAEAIGDLKPVPHRLELMHSQNGITIIDDSYNANEEGVKSALDVIKAFYGRKVVYAQGIVELGTRALEVNKSVGERLSEVADVVILSGRNKKYIESGLMAKGFPRGNIYKFRDFKVAKGELKSILKAGDVFLLQNDLP